MAPSPLFEIQDLKVNATEGPEILGGVNLTVNAGEIHAIMGPNGSGKSTLATTILGSPEYEISSGKILFRGDDITLWGPDIRAKAGMFLAFQYPQEISGVSVRNFLRQAISARKGVEISTIEVYVAMQQWMERLEMDPSFMDRYLNEGFSGGEKKRNEIFQMAMLEPALAILDETDSGLDIDALKVVAKGVRQLNAFSGPRLLDHHPLPASSRLHQARCCSRDVRWPDCQIRRCRTRSRTRGERLRFPQTICLRT